MRKLMSNKKLHTLDEWRKKLSRPRLVKFVLKTCFLRCAKRASLCLFVALIYAFSAFFTFRAEISLPPPTIKLLPNILHIDRNDLVTGERISTLSDIAFYTAEYAKRHSSVFEHAKRLILIDRRFTASDIENIARSRIFFIQMDNIVPFIETVIPHVSAGFVLLTHSSDTITAGSIADLLLNPLLVRWYGCNMLPHVKTRGIPLGLHDRDASGGTEFDLTPRRQGFLGFSTEKRENRKMTLTLTDFDLIEKLRHARKKKLLHVLENTSVHHTLRSRGFDVQRRKSWTAYMVELSQYKFCACPEGSGIDTHRMWECIFLGVIPVVVRTPELYEWYSALPIFWVESFREVTRNRLRNALISSADYLNHTSLITLTGISRSVHEELSLHQLKVAERFT